jgi:ubiquitin C-terminal hydrolase
MSTTQAPKQKVAATRMSSPTSQDKRPALAKIGPESALDAAVNQREALGAGGMLALQAAVGNRAVVGLVQAKRERSSTEDSARVHQAAKLGIGRASAELPHLEEIRPCHEIAAGSAAAETAAPASAPASLLAGGGSRPTLQMLFEVQRVVTPAPAVAPAQMQAAAARGIATPASALPHRDAIQRSFGRHDVSAIQAHTGDAAAESARDMAAQAYAIGSHIVFGAAPDLHTAAHEAAHVVQQRGEVQLKGGVGEAGDPHERHADAVADLVVRGASSEALLDPYAGGATTADTGAVQKQDGPRGLPNRRYDCFLNAVLQILAGPYHQFFAPANPVAPENIKVRDAVFAVLQKVRGGDVQVTPEEIGALRKTLHAAKIVNSEDAQEDAAELMRRILERVLPDGESVGISRTRRLDKEQTEVAEAEQAKDPEVYTDGAVTRAQNTNTIAVDVQRYHDLHGFLYEQYGGGVTTEYSKGNHPKVQNNGKQVTVSKVTERFGFTRLPGVLTFELHRFRIGRLGKERIHKHFDMPKQLFLIREGDKPSYAQYELGGVVVQQGSLSSGHYWSHVHSGKDWYKTNDSEVTKNKVDEDINDGYLYTYVRTAEHAELPKGATALQSTKPEHAPIDVDGDLAGFLDEETPGDREEVGTPSTALQGLPNENAVDCFLNAVLHVLATTVPLDRFDARVTKPDRRVLDSSPPSKPAKPPAKGSGAPRRTGRSTFYAAIKALHPVLKKIVEPEAQKITQKEVDDVRKVLSDHRLVEGVTGQEDAADLMRNLLNLVLPPSADARIGTERTIRSADTQRIEPGELGSNPQSYTSDAATPGATESSQFIAVEIEKYTSLESFLYRRFGVGELVNYDDDNRPKVELDGQAAEVSAATERRVFRALPETLTFVLHRFRQNPDGSRQRINARFAMPTDMVLMAEPEKGSKSYVEYALKAMVVQHGSLSSGHYWAYSKAKGDKWTKANDTTVTESDAIGDDLNKGYVYTYQQVQSSSKPPKDKPVAQTDKNLFADGDLGKRLHLLLVQGKFSEAKALLEFPGINVNTLAKKCSPLMRAIEARQADLVEALLRHGANPNHPEGYNAVSIVKEQGLEDERIGRLLFAYSMSNVTGYRARLEALRTAKTLDKTVALGLMDDIDSALFAVEIQIGMIASPGTDPTGTVGALALNLAALRTLKSEVNAELAKRLGMTRAGAGNRADANKSSAQGLPEDATAKEKQLFAQLTSGQVHQSSSKTTQEALTAVYATRTYPELIDKISLWKGKHDVEFDIAGKPWDQKTVYYAEKPFDGHLHKTYNKLDKPEHAPHGDKEPAKPEPAKSKPAKPTPAKSTPAKTAGSSKHGDDKPPRVGLLFDTTYVEDHNYEHFWGLLLHDVLNDHFDPKNLKETRAPDPDALVSSTIIDEAASSRDPSEKAVLDLQKLATGGSGNRVMRKIAASALPNYIAPAVLAAVKGELLAYSQHRDNRGYLPPGAVYWEYPVSGYNKIKLVISHDRKRLYVTATHYHPYSIRTKSGTTESHHAFFEITPDGDVAKAVAPSAPPTPVTTADPTGKEPAKTKDG